jgi:hypothetical protein
MCALYMMEPLEVRTMPKMRSVTQRWGKVALAGLIAAWASGASAAWVVDEQGQCVRTWTPASLGRGPAAVANAPLVPFRSIAGGVQVARDGWGGNAQRRVLLPALLVAGGAVMGTFEAVVWAVTGVADTLTGGYLEIAPEEATRLSVEPLTPLFVPGARRDSHEAEHQDRCGRPMQ